MTIKCSYPECDQRFDSEEAMIKHKKKAPEHFYCAKCKVDCANDLEFLIHQLSNQIHICCPICGREFRSKTARDCHFEHEHPARQSVICVGCKAKFNRASELMSHIENNRCNLIKEEHFIRHRAEKQIERQAWDYATDPWFCYTVTPADEPETEAVDDALPLLNAISKQSKSATQSKNKKNGSPTLGHVEAVMKELNITKSGGQNKIPERQQPYAAVVSGDVVTNASQLVNKSTQDSVHTIPAITLNDRMPTMFEMLTGIPQNTEAPSFAFKSPKMPMKAHHEKVPMRTPIAIRSEAEAQKYYDPVLRQYICPGLDCEQPLYNLEQFQNHLITYHNRDYVLCPNCGKSFRSTSALISHCESSSRKCNIRNRDDYNDILREITAGLIGTDGHMIDGTARYVAVPIEKW